MQFDVHQSIFSNACFEPVVVCLGRAKPRTSEPKSAETTAAVVGQSESASHYPGCVGTRQHCLPIRRSLRQYEGNSSGVWSRNIRVASSHFFTFFELVLVSVLYKIYDYTKSTICYTNYMLYEDAAIIIRVTRRIAFQPFCVDFAVTG